MSTSTRVSRYLGLLVAGAACTCLGMRVWAQAPANAKWVGMGVRALNQVSEDYAEFSGFSLQSLE